MTLDQRNAIRAEQTRALALLRGPSTFYDPDASRTSQRVPGRWMPTRGEPSFLEQIRALRSMRVPA